MADPLGPPVSGEPATSETVGSVAGLFLGNILYAIERCAMALDEEQKPLDAAFYRGIGRKLAAAHGAGRGQPSD